MGLRRDVAKVLEGAHVFVLPTNWEGLPRSIIEAMRAGLPVVATDVGGVSELVSDGDTGYLVPRQDPKALSLCLRLLIESRDERVRMGRGGRRRYEAEFTFERMAARTLEVYQEVLDESLCGSA